jgi:uncharacterized protein
MKLKVVLDANVILSSLISKNGSPFKVLSSFVTEKWFELFLSHNIIAEWYNCARSKKLQSYANATKEQLDSFILSIVTMASVVEDKNLADGICRDPKDDMYISVAIDINADYIVTCDNDLLCLISIEKTAIINPGHFIKLYRK